MSARNKRKHGDDEVDDSLDDKLKQVKGETNEDNDDDESDDSVEGNADDLYDEDDDDVPDEDGGDSEIDQEIEIEFEAYDPMEVDFEGIKKLLGQLFLKSDIDTSALTNILIKQKGISTIIKQTLGEEDVEDGEDDDIYGIISIINMQDANSSECCEKVKSYLASNSNNNKPVSQILNGGKVGLIINERFINIPAKISLPSYEQLIKEINKKDDYEWFVMICKILRLKDEEVEKMKKNGTEMEKIIYLNPEDEIFDDVADESFEFSVSNQCDDNALGSNNWMSPDGDDKEGNNAQMQLYKPFRRVLFLKKDNWIKAIDKLKEELN